jgi:hypothetical protein
VKIQISSFNSQGRGQRVLGCWEASGCDFTMVSPLLLKRIAALPTLAASAILPPPMSYSFPWELNFEI